MQEAKDTRLDDFRQMLLWRRNPSMFFKDVLGCSAWYKQLEIAEMVRDNSFVTVRSCNGAGKTFIAARIILWFLFSHYPSRVIVTSPSTRQVVSGVWGEVGKAYRSAKIPLGGELLQQELRLKKDFWYALAFATDDSVKFQGQHEQNILFVVDEASGVLDDIYESIEGSLGAGDAKILLIGNPNYQVGYFAESFLKPAVSAKWKHIHISAYDTPNVIAGKNVLHGVCNHDWPEQKKKEWGEEDNRYLVRVLGDFPKESTNTLINYGDCQFALHNRIELDSYKDEPKILGVDCARFGDDKTIILSKQGGCVRILRKIDKSDAALLAGELTDICKNDKDIVQVNIDSVGFGGGVVDILEDNKTHGEGTLKRVFENIDIVAVNVQTKAVNDIDFENFGAELAFRMRDDFKNHMLDIIDDDLLSQANNRRYKFNKKGKYVLEEKDIFKKEQKRSPDEMDSLMIAYAGVDEDEQKPGLFIW